jgi:serine/threonine-protein kinase
VLGTPLYMSPEQARGDEQLDHRIDIYAVGVIMYELATGEVPFRGSNYLNIISQVLSADAKPPRQMRPDLDISEDFEAVVLKALAKDRDQRYQSMEELTNDLKALAGGGMVGATSGSFWAMKKRGARGRSPLRALGWVAAVAVVIAAMAFTINTVMSGEEAVDGAAGPAAIDAGPAVARVTIDAGPLDPGVEVVDIELVSTPPGATVWADGGQRLICEPTPCKWPAVKKDRAVRLIFELDGYDDAEIEINPLTSGPSQKVRLNKIKKGRKKKSLRKNTGTTKPPSGEDDTVSGELMGNPIKKKKQQKGD